MIVENREMADRYEYRSVAEQNSLELCWNLLLEPRFKELRATVYATSSDMQHFRELLVNSIMATDIIDTELKELRNARWEKAFSPSESPHESSQESINRKATIVIEHLIQASDVAHTMQHWHVYRKWNENLFREMYRAYRMGRSTTNPAEFWYDGEIGFFGKSTYYRSLE